LLKPLRSEGVYPKTVCAERGINYFRHRSPGAAETFSAYAWPSGPHGPGVEEKLVARLDLFPGRISPPTRGWRGGANSEGRAGRGDHPLRTHPRALAHLPKEFLSHSFEHHRLEPFPARRGGHRGGASATDLAGLLRDADAEVQLVARQHR